MDAAAAKLIGAGIATFGMGLAALGVGIIFGMYLQGALRNPAAANSQRPNLLFNLAEHEPLGFI